MLSAGHCRNAFSTVITAQATEKRGAVQTAPPTPSLNTYLPRPTPPWTSHPCRELVPLTQTTPRPRPPLLMPQKKHSGMDYWSKR